MFKLFDPQKFKIKQKTNLKFYISKALFGILFVVIFQTNSLLAFVLFYKILNLLTLNLLFVFLIILLNNTVIINITIVDNIKFDFYLKLIKANTNFKKLAGKYIFAFITLHLLEPQF